MKTSEMYRRYKSVILALVYSLYEQIKQRWLSELFAVIYLLYIPGFAWRYSTMNHAFFGTNLQLERSFSDDANDIVSLVCSVLNTAWDNRASSDERTLSIGDSSVSFPSERLQCFGPLTLAADKSATFGLGLGAIRIVTKNSKHVFRRIPGDTISEQVFGSFDINVVMQSLIGQPRFELSDSEVRLLRYEIRYEISDVDFKEEIEQFIARLILGPAGIKWRGSTDVAERLEKYKSGATGFTSDVSGNYWRMFYFSAITVTTVGYGDIVPITPAARAWVTAEAILGVVTIGFFLASLAPAKKDKGRTSDASV